MTKKLHNFSFSKNRQPMKRKYGNTTTSTASTRRYTPRRYVRRRTGRSTAIVPGRTRQTGYFGRYNKLSSESKFFDLQEDSIIITDSGVIIQPSLNLITGGTSENNRIGRKCTISSIHMKGTLTLPPTLLPAETTDVCRIVLYLDKQCNGAAATFDDIFDSNITVQDEVFKYRNLANSGRFQILYDKTYSLESLSAAYNGTTTSFGGATKGFKINKVVNTPIEISNSGTPTITDIRTNNYGLLGISKNGLVDMSYVIRMRFVG